MVELTGCRAGFLLCNNLEIAARMIQAEPPMGAVELTPKEKIEELLLFSGVGAVLPATRGARDPD